MMIQSFMIQIIVWSLLYNVYQVHAFLSIPKTTTSFETSSISRAYFSKNEDHENIHRNSLIGLPYYNYRRTISGVISSSSRKMSILKASSNSNNERENEIRKKVGCLRRIYYYVWNCTTCTFCTFLIMFQLFTATLFCSHKSFVLLLFECQS